MSPDQPGLNLEQQIAELEARVRGLEAMQELVLRILSATNPLNSVLKHYGATETQEKAFSKLLDELVVRARGPAQNRPSLAYFEMKVAEIFPEHRRDRQFTTLLVDTLKVDRPAYRELHAYAIASGWPHEADNAQRT